MINLRSDIASTRRWVVKVGTAVLTQDGLTLSQQVITSLARQITQLRERGIEVVLVSSGSIAAGIGQLNMSARPERLNQLQAAAAVGQAALLKSYDSAFAEHGITIAQVLLTHADVANRKRYLNARNTLQGLLSLGALAIINENDTVATEEICFGDNDNLAALVANMIEADLLVLLTDQDGLYDSDPRKNPQAALISSAHADDVKLAPMAGAGSSLGRGGMVTKLTAATKASHSGACTVIANGSSANVLTDILCGADTGTLLLAGGRVSSKKQWMAGQMRSEGVLQLDSGAQTVLREQGRSLLAVGVADVRGEFDRGALVTCVDQSGQEIARGLINYGSKEALKLKGVHSDKFADILGYRGDHELIHRDNLVVF